MGVSNHERSSPVIEDNEQQASFLEMEDDSYLEQHPWRHAKTQQRQPPPPERSLSDENDQKHVSFASLEIREYNQVLGDHPCCTVGPPVSLGWDYTESPKVNVEAYEATRPRRRTRQSLRLSFKARREILSEVASDADVRRVQRRLSRERCCDNRTIKTFFGTAAE